MGKEIERKFLVNGDGWRGLAEGVAFRQGFLSTAPERVVRVRIAGDQGTLTIKGVTEGFSREEFEYVIPLEDATTLLDKLCQRPIIEKTRHKIIYAGSTWEVDEFVGENAGLILAEVELTHEGESFQAPPWLGREVSDDARYFNANLVQYPFTRWPENGGG